MKADATTNGRLAELLETLGFTRKSRDDRYDVYSEPVTDMWFPLPKGKPQAAARTSHIDALRLQLSYRGLMNEADFDAYLARPVGVQS